MILVTGTNGFVGKNLTELLHQTGRKTVSVKRYAAGSPDSGRKEIIIQHISANTDWTQALSNIDIIIHLAAVAHESRIRQKYFHEVNTLGTLNLARQAAKAGVSRFIFISSIGVNGNRTLGKPFTIKDTPNPAESYAISKNEAEIGLRQVATETSMEVVVIRPPLVYGANAPGNFGRLIHTVARGIPLPLGAIHNQRSLVALPNLIDLITTCIDHPAAANQTFLVSDDEDLSTTELLQRLSKALGKPSRLLPVPQTLLETSLKLIGKGDIAQRLCGNLQIDISKTKQLLDWKPPVSVDEALRQTAQAYLQVQR